MYVYMTTGQAKSIKYKVIMWIQIKVYTFINVTWMYNTGNGYTNKLNTCISEYTQTSSRVQMHLHPFVHIKHSDNSGRTNL